MELATAARMAGADVELFLRSQRLALRVLPGVVAETLEALHRAHGVRLHPGVAPIFKEHDTGISCQVGDAHIGADHLLVAIGMSPNDGLARRAGPECNGGIVTDDIGTTGHPSAIGIGIDRPEQIHRVSRRLAALPRDQPITQARAPVPRAQHRLCTSDEVPDGALVRIAYPAHGPLCATRQDGRAHVTDDRCPHSVAALSHGFVEGGRLVCPLHFAEFDLTDGRPHYAPEGCGALMIYPATERGGQIFVELPV